MSPLIVHRRNPAGRALRPFFMDTNTRTDHTFPSHGHYARENDHLPCPPASATVSCALSQVRAIRRGSPRGRPGICRHQAGQSRRPIERNPRDCRTRRPHGPVQPAHAASAYTARHLSVLEGLEAVRKRPGMYIGSTDAAASCTACGRSSTTRWTRRWPATAPHRGGLHADGSAEVRDNGRGIPVDVEPEDRAHRRRAGDDPAARRRQVRRRLLHRLRRPARRRGLGGERPGRPAGRERRPGGHEWAASFRRGVPGEFAADGPTASSAGDRAAHDPQGGQGR
jgi:hypothetical protein